MSNSKANQLGWQSEIGFGFARKLQRFLGFRSGNQNATLAKPSGVGHEKGRKFSFLCGL